MKSPVRVKHIYNFDLLKNFCEKNNVTLLHNYKDINITCHSVIEGKCLTENCDKTFRKQFCSIIKFSSAYCESCITKRTKDKISETVLSRYGVTHHMKSPEVNQKRMATNLKRYGANHALNGYKTVKPNCCFENCDLRPYYNTAGNPARYCFIHKTPEMINVNCKPCAYEGCKKLPSFNYLGGPRLYCGTHKLAGMVNPFNDRYFCVHEGCGKNPSFNFDGTGSQRMYCSEHKLSGMINISKRNLLCVHPDCSTIANFNLHGFTSGLYCNIHKLDGMINVTRRLCQYPDCSKTPTYNLAGETKAVYCSQHRTDGMVDCVHKTCKNEGCYIVVKDRKNIEKYDGYCVSCFMYVLFGRKLSKHHTKTREFKASKEYAAFCLLKSGFTTSKI